MMPRIVLVGLVLLVYSTSGLADGYNGRHDPLFQIDGRLAFVAATHGRLSSDGYYAV